MKKTDTCKKNDAVLECHVELIKHKKAIIFVTYFPPILKCLPFTITAKELLRVQANLLKINRFRKIP